ncbi:jg9645 [Pararge aegeria aegeria]|uniref:Jg9645 protein n=1 Tax=Pararge aegeria aegeria TaxID=348720 RepID=A0A8S4RRH9_9NEOP|nr:jg9645 [Pararge aegeria aegeria]
MYPLRTFCSETALSGRGGGSCAYYPPPADPPPALLNPANPPLHSHFVFAQNPRKPALDFTEDPFKDYRYEDPFNIEDPFADVTDTKKIDPFARSTSAAGFATEDFFTPSSNINGLAKPDRHSGRVSAPPVPYDPFTAAQSNNNDTWAAWPTDNWAMAEAWAEPAADAWTTTNTSKTSSTSNTSKTGGFSSDWKTDNWANKTDNGLSAKTDNWATDWDTNANTTNKNLNETWPTNTLPSKKEKSPKPVKYARSLVNTIGGIGRTRHNKDKKAKPVEAKSSAIPSEETQWAWAAAESKRLNEEAEARRQQEDAELQLALAISRQEK